MFYDLNLRTLYNHEMETALLGAGFYFDEEGCLTHKDSSLDTIGTIYKEIKEEVVVEIVGWHVNLRTTNLDVVKSLESITIQPQTPNRVWA